MFDHAHDTLPPLGTGAQTDSALDSAFNAVIAQQPPLEAAVATVNAALGGVPMLVRADDGTLQASYHVDDEPSAAMSFWVAHAALTLLTNGDPLRLHHCQNPRCILRFYDATKRATRRWCSQACMNRARSLQRYARRKQNERGV